MAHKKPVASGDLVRTLQAVAAALLKGTVGRGVFQPIGIVVEFHRKMVARQVPLGIGQNPVHAFGTANFTALLIKRDACRAAVLEHIEIFDSKG